MKKIIFITTLTPQQNVSPLRTSLFEIYLKALQSQSYPHWNALLIGEFDKDSGNIKYIKTDAVSKSDKLLEVYKYLLNLPTKPDYLIRLDDDDIISPFALEQAANDEFDCFADEFHSFYDITSATISQQKRAWLPNTIIHKYQHAITPFGAEGLPLFAQDHSKTWHNFYADKKIVYSEKLHPLYLRVISPTTITSRLNNNAHSKDTNFNIKLYNEYLKTFGKWKKSSGDDVFRLYCNDLIRIWEEHSNTKITSKRKHFW